jgi:chloramphenicol O-acetyltransferase type A
MFKKIDIENWERKEHFKVFTEKTPCSYNIKTNSLKFYPYIISIIAKAVNKHAEFRTAYNSKGELGIYDYLNPSYTVMNEQNENFISIWSAYNHDQAVTYENIIKDIDQFKNCSGISPKPDTPENVLNISAIPWVSFTGFNLNLYSGQDYFLPIFTIGKFFNQDSETLLPLSIQVHHAVADGFHVSRLINDIQNMIN